MVLDNDSKNILVSLIEEVNKTFYNKNRIFENSHLLGDNIQKILNHFYLKGFNCPQMFKGILNKFLSVIIHEIKWFKDIFDSNFLINKQYLVSSQLSVIMNKIYSIIECIKEFEDKDIFKKNNDYSFIEIMRNIHNHLWTSFIKSKKSSELRDITNWIYYGLKNNFFSKFIYIDLETKIKYGTEILSNLEGKKFYVSNSDFIDRFLLLSNDFQTLEFKIELILWICLSKDDIKPNKIRIELCPNEIFNFLINLNNLLFKAFNKINNWSKKINPEW